MTSINLSPRASREQRTFRKLLNATARPGSVATLDLPDSRTWFTPLVSIAEALLDHEVTFAALPEHPDLVDALLRQTASRIAPPADAGYVFCESRSLAQALRTAKDGSLEYPDSGATVVCLVEAVSGWFGPGRSLVLEGPGIRDRLMVWVKDFSSEAKDILSERNSQPPLGIDLVLVDGEGSFTCLTRYTRFIKEAD